MTKTMELMCVGMRHRVTPTTLREMSNLAPLKIELRRDPENIHDENAIAVYVIEKPWKGMHVGYVSRQTAAEIAPRMDTGEVQFTTGYLNTVDDESGLGEMTVEFEKSGKASRRAKN